MQTQLKYAQIPTREEQGRHGGHLTFVRKLLDEKGMTIQQAERHVQDRNK